MKPRIGIQRAVGFVVVLSLVCIISQFFELRIRGKRKARKNTLRFISKYLGKSERLLQQQNFDRLDVIDMKIKEVKMVDRIKVQDEVTSHKHGEMRGKSQGEKDNEIIDEYAKRKDGLDVGKDDITPSSPSSVSSLLHSNGNSESMAAIQSKNMNIVSETSSEGSPTKKGFRRGYLNLHIWDNICEFSVESLTEFVLFPSLPKYRKFTNKPEVNDLNIKNSGIRIFGFLHPDQTGLYRFGISSVGNSAIWLSNDTLSSNAKKIAFVGSESDRRTTIQGKYDELPSQTSKYVSMKKGDKYFIEILYKHTSGASRIQVTWMKPQSSHFEVIPATFLSVSINDSHVGNNTADPPDYDSTNVAMDTTGLNDMPFMEFVDFEEAFSECDYKPSYYITEKLVRFQGARNKSNTHFAEIYPPDRSSETLPLVKRKDVWWVENNLGNDVIDNETAMHVGKMFNESLEKKYKKDFRIVAMMSLERVKDKIKGSRYHIQMKIEDIFSGRHYEFSEFLYQPKGSGSLCFPRGFRWSKNAFVNIIVPVKNSGRWLMYFIKNIAEIIDKTRDPLVRVTIVDYASTDIDIDAVMKKSNIFRYTVVRMPANKTFNRAEALQKGAETIIDQHSIIFICDLHLTIPVNFIGTIRKHCIEGKMAFAPVVKRLKCGYYPSKPLGYWETLGFGLFALYKSDFDRVGAMNVEEFKGWGGEDWELLDRVLESRMEVERLKIPSFYHFFHPAYGNEQSRVDAK